MFGMNIGRPGAVGGVSIYAQVLAQLFRRGDTLWLPGVGVVNDLPTGNYIESTGSTATAANGLTGLAIDAQSTAQAALTLSAWGSASMTQSVVDGWQRGTSTASPAWISTSFPSVAGQTYRVSGLLRKSAGSWRYLVGTSSGGNQIFSGTTDANLDAFVVATAALTYISVRSMSITIGNYVEAKDVTAVPVPGIHLRQSTTADKPFLRLTGSVYRWEFDTTDTLAATIPATGYGNSTVIYSLPGGQVTQTNQNLSAAGVLTLGPNSTVHAVILCRDGTTLTSAELALYQLLANKLAGL